MMLYPKRLRIVRGDVRDTSRVEKAVAGQDALMSTLGNTKTSRRDAQAEGIKNTVNDAMRIIWSLLKLLQKDVLEDAKGHARVIVGSGLEWLIVRAPC